MQKRADTSYPVHDLIAERWSPRAFAASPVTPEQLGSLFEAARWAPSCFNEQPWAFLVAVREDRADFERLAACLMDGNAWAREAGVLIATVAKTEFARNGKPNRHARHDLGLAVQSLVLQAQALGLVAHQMAGFDADRARADLGIPPGCEPVTMIALGHPGEPGALPEELARRERAPRERKPLDSFVFGAGWERPLAPLATDS